MASLITFDLDISTSNRYQEMSFAASCSSCRTIVPSRFAKVFIKIKYPRSGDLLISILLLHSNSILL